MATPEFIFVKSSRSGGGNGADCVEVARNVPGVVAVQDSKDPGPALVVASDAWRVFLASVRG